MNDSFRSIQVILEQIRKSLASSLTRGTDFTAAIARFEPLLQRAYRDGFLAEWLSAASSTVAPLRGVIPEIPGLPPAPRNPFAIPGAEPIVRLPMIEQASLDLYRRGLFTPAEYEALDQDARRAAFTLARTQSIETIGKVRDALAENTREGGTLQDFRDRLGETLDSIPLSPAQVETTYRTQQAQAYSAGQRAILDHPLVYDQFPYLLWSATHDSRVRPDHLAMERHGQNGTAVYRADDPIWSELYPPAGYNCRCVVIPLTVEDAAKHGSQEARRWLESGTPPLSPDWSERPYPIDPPAGWPTHSRIEAVT